MIGILVTICLVINALLLLGSPNKLLPLCQPNGTIKRAEWEKYETTIEGSLFQICANALGKGKPYTLDD